MKLKDNVLWIFGQSLNLYLRNFKSFFIYMSFPVFGQILGMILVLAATFFYTNVISNVIGKEAALDNFSTVILILFVLLIPGFLVFTKALWDFMVSYGAVNSMVGNMLKSGKVYDFPAHTELITRKSAKFGSLWLTLGLMAIIGVFPLFWVIAGIMFVYFILVFQVFTFEPDKSIFGCLKKSVDIIKGHFAKTFMLMCLIGGLSYLVLPYAIQFVCDFLHITNFLATLINGFTAQLPIEEINSLLNQFHTGYHLTSLMIGKFAIVNTLGYIITCLTLPLRSICWSLWYKALNKAEVKLDKKILERAEKKA